MNKFKTKTLIYYEDNDAYEFYYVISVKKINERYEFDTIIIASTYGREFLGKHVLYYLEDFENEEYFHIL